MSHKNKVAILLPDLRGGGVEKMRIALANVWLDRGYEVDFVLVKAQGSLLTTVKPTANIVNLNCNKMLFSVPKIVNYLNASKPDVLLVAMWPLTIVGLLSSLLALKSKKTKVIVSDHNTLSLSTRHKSAIYQKLLGLSIRIFYPISQHAVVVSKGVGKDLAKLSGLEGSFFSTIYNPAASVESIETSQPKAFNYHKYNLLAVGSLKEQKGFDVLIEAMKIISKQKTDVCLHILGDGPLRFNIEKQIQTLKLENHVILHGFIHNVNDFFSFSDAFILSSRWEGFGNVIVEALQFGTPVVSTDCESGPREILENGKYGKLVPVGDAKALASAMYESLHEQHDTEALKRRAQDFSVEKIAKQYLDVMFPKQRK
mgnify:CR=1 FL=1